MGLFGKREGHQIRSFVISEDHRPLFEGSAAGLIRHTSDVPQRVEDLRPMISSIRMERRMEKLAKAAGKKPQENMWRFLSLLINSLLKWNLIILIGMVGSRKELVLPLISKIRILWTI